MRKVYLDNSATTMCSAEALNEMLPCYSLTFGNSNSLHSFGRDASAIVDKARDRIAHAINAQKSNEIYFTSGGTEADNWAIKGIASAYRAKGNHIITSSIEHHAVLDSCAQLEAEGFKVTYLPVDENGLVSIADIMHSITPETILISVMAVNNEIGTVQNIKAIGVTAHEKNIVFHVDAVQAFGAIKIDVQDMNIDALSISSHKIYGPKGVGALYVSNSVKIDPLIIGGNQERRKRGGTINVPCVAGFGKAAEIASNDLFINVKKIKSVRSYFVEQLTEKIPYIRFNGHPYQKSQSIVSVSFEMIEGESILLMLDMKGIAVSTGSACTSGTLEPSYVLRAIGVPDEIAQGTIRFSFSKSTTKEDVDYVVENLVEIVSKLRSISPITRSGRSKKNV